MKTFILGLASIVSALFALVAFVNLLYNLCGLVGVQDCASGPVWESALVALVCAVVAFAAGYLSYRLGRSITFLKDPK
jgi:hypothetical protein